MTEFTPFPKIPRLFRDIVITEKIDGTNAAITFTPEDGWTLITQSRSRVIISSDDNFGFARWAENNAEALFEVLGFGTHFGEWWGSGIQRGYGLPKGEKRFSLFNVHRWKDVDFSSVPGLGVVPTMYTGPFCEREINRSIELLNWQGSYAAPGFTNPEGIIVFHTAANSMFKITCKNDEKPKGSNE